MGMTTNSRQPTTHIYILNIPLWTSILLYTCKQLDLKLHLGFKWRSNLIFFMSWNLGISNGFEIASRTTENISIGPTTRKNVL